MVVVNHWDGVGEDDYCGGFGENGHVGDYGEDNHCSGAYLYGEDRMVKMRF